MPVAMNLSKDTSNAAYGHIYDLGYEHLLFTAHDVMLYPDVVEDSVSAAISQLDEAGAIENLGRAAFLHQDVNGKLITVRRFVYRLTPKILGHGRKTAIDMLAEICLRLARQRRAKSGR